jgi:hypothetical protein
MDKRMAHTVASLLQCPGSSVTEAMQACKFTLHKCKPSKADGGLPLICRGHVFTIMLIGRWSSNAFFVIHQQKSQAILMQCCKEYADALFLQACS